MTILLRSDLIFEDEDKPEAIENIIKKDNDSCILQIEWNCACTDYLAPKILILPICYLN